MTSWRCRSASHQGVRVVVVSPHRADAAFSLGLAIPSWLAAGHRVEILNCFTQSEHAPFSDVDSLHGNDKRSFVSAVRRREDIAWNKLLGGRLKFTDLEMLDAPLRLSCSLDDVLAVEIRAGDRALARVSGALRKVADRGEPGQLALVLPLAVGEHIDHRVVHGAAFEALRATDLPIAFYEDLPYAARPGAAASIENRVAASGFALRPCFAEPVAVDVHAATRRKHQTIDCYDSQVDNQVALQMASFGEIYGGRERLWGNDAWLASPLNNVVEIPAGI